MELWSPLSNELKPLVNIDDLDSQESHDAFAKYQNKMGRIFNVKVDGGLAGIMFDNKEQWKDMSREERIEQICEYQSKQYQECLHLEDPDKPCLED